MVYFINRGGGVANEGPISESDVREQIANGRLGMNALIWAEGMPEWVTVSAWMNQSGVSSPSVSSLPPISPTPSCPADIRPVAPGYGLPVPAHQKGTACVTMALVGSVLTILSMVGMFVAGIVFEVMQEYGATPLNPDDMFSVLALCVLAMAGSFVISLIGWTWSIVRVWRVLQMVKPQIGEKLPTPGWAAGALFIPLFGFYWIFVAYGAIPKFVRRLPGNPPEINETNIILMNVGLVGGIFIPPLTFLNVVCSFIFLSQVRKFLKWADGQG